jgi:flagellin
MSLLINSSTSAHYLKQNQVNLQMSLNRLSSGKRITGGADDPGGLAVAMKLGASVKRLQGAQNNVANALSFMEVQDGLLQTAGQVVTRISELKGLHGDDPLKSATNRAAYDLELQDLLTQLEDMTTMTFNGELIFNDAPLTINYDEDAAEDLTLAVTAFTAAVSPLYTGITTFDETAAAGTFLDVATIDTALEAVAGLRAQNGSGQNRLSFAAESLSLQKINLTAALGRIENVDLATESAELAKNSILTQSSAMMVSQANSMNDIAMMLLQ